MRDDSAPTKLSRRRFLLWIPAAVAALAGVAYYRRSRGPDLVASAVRKTLSYLRIDDTELVRFADNYMSYALPEHRAWLRAHGHLALVHRHTGFLYRGRDAELFRALDETASSAFLLSSDFFEHGADESRPVRYLRYYDPYAFACGNPFAEL